MNEFVTVSESRTVIAHGIFNINISRGTFKVACINAPKLNGEVDKEYLEDLALETGTYCFADQNGRELKDATLNDLGRAKAVLILKHMTIIVGGECNDYSQVQARGQKILDILQDTTDLATKDLLKRRYRELMAHSVLVYTGADTETLTKKRLESILPLINKRNERIALDNSSLEGVGLSEEQKQCVKDYYDSLAQKEENFKELVSMREECKTRAQQQLAEMKRKQEEQKAIEQRRIEEERQRIEEERWLIEKQKEDERQRERIRSEANQELDKLHTKKGALQSELSNLKGLFTKRRRTEIEALLGEIEKEEQRLMNILYL